MQRRRFMTLCAGAAGGAAGLAALGLRPGARPDLGVLQTVTVRGHGFGTHIGITALHPHEPAARQAAEAALEELARVESIMSIYRADSQLSRLNRDGVLDRPHPYLVEVLQAAETMASKSRGAFDVTVQPLWDLAMHARAAGRPPSILELGAAARRVNWRKLEVTPERIRFLEKGMAATLNGIAQGYAADRALKVLRGRGVEHALVHSGEIGSLGAKDRKNPWRVGIQHPRVANAFAAMATLRGGCLATSGDYETAFADDFSEHHIFDPRTGRSPRELASVTVLAPDGLWADALSTAAFVTGVEEGEALVRSLPGAEAFFIRKDGSAVSTPGFPQA